MTLYSVTEAYTVMICFMILDNEAKPGHSLYLTAVDPEGSEKSVLRLCYFKTVRPIKEDMEKYFERKINAITA